MTGCSVAGVLHVLNKTPIDWCSKKKHAVETETRESDGPSARTYVEQILDLRITLWHLGAPICKIRHVLGGNDSTVNSSMTPQGKSHKRHADLSFHRVREDIVDKIVSYLFTNGKMNPTYVLSNNWAHHHVRPTLKSLLFWRVGPMECLDKMLWNLRSRVRFVCFVF